MKVTQESERVFTVVLNDAELEYVMHEAVYSEISALNVMKAIFLMTFMQVMSCRYWRSELSLIDKDKYRVKYENEGNIEQDGG